MSPIGASSPNLLNADQISGYRLVVEGEQTTFSNTDVRALLAQYESRVAQGTPYATGEISVSADDSPCPDGMTDFAYIEFDDDEPDFLVDGRMLPAEQVGEILAYAVADIVRRVVEDPNNARFVYS